MQLNLWSQLCYSTRIEGAGTMSQQKIQRMVWTGAIAAVTATGAWYGAGLKTRQEIEQVRFPFSFVLRFFSTPFWRHTH